MRKIVLIVFTLISLHLSAQQKDTTKTFNLPQGDYDRLFTSVQIESTFVGDWSKFLQTNLNADYVRDRIPKKAVPKNGLKITTEVHFTVCTDGSLCDFQIANDVPPAAAEEVLRVMKLSPKWKPGNQNGIDVKSRKLQKITFFITRD